MPEATKRAVLVTGAYSGIGGAIAARLVGEGYRVFGTSRKPPSGKDGALQGVEHVALDVVDDASVKACVAQVEAQGGPLEVLVNNAGYLQAGAVEEVSLDDAHRQFETNYFGALRMINAVLPGMRARGRGRIINITSLAGVVPLPFWGHYNASKAALESLSETLRQEVTPFGVHVSVVEPGAIKTPFYAADRQAPTLEAYRPWRDRFNKRMKEFEAAAPGPELVAAAVSKIVAARSPALRYRVTSEATLFTLMRTWFPEGLYLFGQRKGLKLDDASY